MGGGRGDFAGLEVVFGEGQKENTYCQGKNKNKIK
jgi:hypothetical protein